MQMFPTFEVRVIAPPPRERGPAWDSPRAERESRAVSGVLPQPGGSSDLEAARPDGVRVAMTFHWPKADRASLKGCRIEYGGREYRVIGDPQPYAFAPGPFDRAVETEAVDG